VALDAVVDVVVDVEVAVADVEVAVVDMAPDMESDLMSNQSQMIPIEPS